MEIQTVTNDSLAVFRQQVQEEKELPKKFSDAAAAKFAAIKAQDKIDAVDAERFRNALRSVVITPENLEKLIMRCNTSKPVTDIDKRVRKLEWWITAGYTLGREIDTVGMINFFSEPTSTDNLLTVALANKIRAGRAVEIAEHPCKSGNKCLRFEKRRPAMAKGSSAYCGAACAASDRARAKRAPVPDPIAA